MDEIARGRATTAQRALRGFDRDAESVGIFWLAFLGSPRPSRPLQPQTSQSFFKHAAASSNRATYLGHFRLDGAINSLWCAAFRACRWSPAEARWRLRASSVRSQVQRLARAACGLAHGAYRAFLR